jgi:hypothetical protein
VLDLEKIHNIVRKGEMNPAATPLSAKLETETKAEDTFFWEPLSLVS